MTSRCPHIEKGHSYCSRGLNSTLLHLIARTTQELCLLLDLLFSRSRMPCLSALGLTTAAPAAWQTNAVQHAVHMTQARRAERSREREERVKNLGGTLRKESTPGLPLAVVLAGGMAIAEQVRMGSGLGLYSCASSSLLGSLLPVRGLPRLIGTIRCAGVSPWQLCRSILAKGALVHLLLIS